MLVPLSDRALLIPFWITVAGRHPYGVSAYSLADALHLLRERGMDVDPDAAGVRVREGVTFADLDQDHVAPNIGPMQLRGVWYPRANL